MSNANYTHMVLLVDASGSMQNNKQATIDGINNFIESQKQLAVTSTDRNLSLEYDLSDGHKDIKCTVTLVTFSSIQHLFGTLATITNNGEPGESYSYNELYKGVDINATIPLSNENYSTQGGTPLVDAFYKAVTDCSAFINRLPEDQRPGRIIFISNTDGEENTSTKHNRTELRLLVEEKTKLNWQFIYLGANQDAFNESHSYGVAAGQALNYTQTSEGITRGYSALSTNVSMKRMTSSTADMLSYCISDMDDSTIRNQFNRQAPTGTSTTSSINILNAMQNSTTSYGPGSKGIDNGVNTEENKS